MHIMDRRAAHVISSQHLEFMDVDAALDHTNVPPDQFDHHDRHFDL